MSTTLIAQPCDCGEPADVFRDGDTWLAGCPECGRFETGATRNVAVAAWNADVRKVEHLCSGCRHYEIGGKVDYCRLVRQMRKPDDYCSRWVRA